MREFRQLIQKVCRAPIRYRRRSSERDRHEGHFIDDETAFFKMRFERTGEHRVELEDFHGDIVFYVTVNAPDEAIYTIDFKTGTTSIITADGTTTPFEPVVVYYKALHGRAPGVDSAYQS